LIAAAPAAGAWLIFWTLTWLPQLTGCLVCVLG
jgi:hypothetical protein